MRQRAAAVVDSELTVLYWQVGRRISEEILRGERAEYGKQVIENLSREFTASFGRGWSKRNLLQMVKFAREFEDEKIVQTMSEKLSWSHFSGLLTVDDPLKREFYLSMAIEERWSVRTPLSKRRDRRAGEQANLWHIDGF